MLPNRAPYPFFTDLDGAPLDDGSIYYGVANANPMTAPLPVFWDADGLEAAAQPIKTRNGLQVRTGTPANVYADDSYSMSVYNRRGQLVYHYADSSKDSVLALDGSTPMTGDLQMGGNKITGLAAGIANTDAVNVGQLPTFGAWNSGLITVVPSSGAFINANAVIHYKLNAKTVAFSVVVNLIDNGTGTGTINVALPWTALTESAFGGRESQTSGFAVAGTVAAGASTLVIVKYDNTYPGANNHRITINGIMETT